jgi:plasmid stabilization system protein ParE
MRVRLTPVVLEDIAAIYQAHNAGFAKRAEDAVFDALDSFATFPQFGVETDEVGVHRWPIREFNYTIFYRISWKKEIIEVVRIMDARQVRDLKRVPR